MLSQVTGGMFCDSHGRYSVRPSGAKVSMGDAGDMLYECRYVETYGKVQHEVEESRRIHPGAPL